jgi:hypothetical protein
MNTSVKRVPKDKFEREIEDNMVSGWSLKSQNDNVAIMEKPGGFGKIWVHILLFLFTSWWTICLGNLAYAAYSYMSNGKELHIKVESLMDSQVAPVS